MDLSLSLQDKFAPNLICFGCGPANEKGLQIKSYVRGDKVVCEFNPQSHHRAFEGMVNGGIIGSLIDCHMNWTAAWHLMNLNQADVPPCCVTAEFRVVFKAPTPIDRTLHLVAWVVDSSPRKAVINAEIGYFDDLSDSKEMSEAMLVTAVGEGTFVAVREGHPAFHRW